MTRQNMTYIIIGQQGTGKSDLVKNMVKKIFQHNPSINKLVIFDEFDSDIWHSLKTWNHPEWASDRVTVVNEEQLLRLKKGNVRLVQQSDDMNYYMEILSKLRNSIIVMEDASRYFPPEHSVPKKLMSVLLNAKQTNVEIFMIFHNLMDVPARLARNCRIIILQHTEDYECPKKLASPKIKAAFNKLRQPPLKNDPYAKVVIPVNVNLQTSNN